MIIPSKHHKQQLSLCGQIRAAELRVSNRQRQIGMVTATLTKKIGQQLSTPANLLLAGGIGFILGELTKQPSTKDKKCNNLPKNKATPFKIALNLISSIRTVYSALPLVLIMTSAYKKNTAKPTPEPSTASEIKTLSDNEKL